MFHESLEGAWLDKVDRRYAWLCRTLVTYEEECQYIFPAEWGIPERVTIQFCNTTRSVSVYERERERESDSARERESLCLSVLAFSFPVQHVFTLVLLKIFPSTFIIVLSCSYPPILICPSPFLQREPVSVDEDSFSRVGCQTAAVCHPKDDLI